MDNVWYFDDSEVHALEGHDFPYYTCAMAIINSYQLYVMGWEREMDFVPKWTKQGSSVPMLCFLVLCFRRVKELSSTSGPGKSSMLSSKGTFLLIGTSAYLTLALPKFR